jgi:hypothetical protein
MSALDYPPPSHCAYIWHRGDALCIGLPDFAGGASVGHTLVVPLAKLAVPRDKADQRGWQILLDVLFARKHDSDARHALSTPSAPTSRQLEALLAGHKIEAWSADGRRKLAEVDLWEEVAEYDPSKMKD